MFFDSVCPTRPSDTVTKYKIYPTILLMERIYKWSWVLFCNFILWLAKPGSKMPCILLFETEYSLEFVYTNLPFLSRPSDTKIQTAITWCLQQQKSQKFENVRLWTSIFRYENLKIVSLITSELFNRNLSIVHPTLFFQCRNSPTNTGVFRLKLPGGAQSGCSAQKYFLLIPWTKILHRIYFLRAALSRTIYRNSEKSQFLGV